MLADASLTPQSLSKKYPPPKLDSWQQPETDSGYAPDKLTNNNAPTRPLRHSLEVPNTRQRNTSRETCLFPRFLHKEPHANQNPTY